MFSRKVIFLEGLFTRSSPPGEPHCHNDGVCYCEVPKECLGPKDQKTCRHISVYNIIHLWPLLYGDIKQCFREEVIFLEGLFTRRSHILRMFVYPKKSYFSKVCLPEEENDFLEKYEFFGSPRK
jgi:hypothetical protein